MIWAFFTRVLNEKLRCDSCSFLLPDKLYNNSTNNHKFILQNVGQRTSTPLWYNFRAPIKAYKWGGLWRRPQIHMFSTVWVKFDLFKSLQRCQHTSQISIHKADSIAGLLAECWSRFSRSDYRALLPVCEWI